MAETQLSPECSREMRLLTATARIGNLRALRRPNLGSKVLKSVPSFRTAVVLSACAVVAAGAAGAAPGDRVFTIANYPVEATASNAVEAKEKAIAEGQQAAFRSLLKRIVPVTAYNRLEQAKTFQASSIVDGYAVRSERNSATEYIASLDFTYQPDAVRQLLSEQGVPFVDTQAPQVVIIAVTRDAKASGDGEFRASAAWSEAWKGLDLSNTLTPARLEAPTPAITSPMMRALADGDFSNAGVLVGEYKSERVLLAVSEVDTSAQRMTVTLTGQDAVGPMTWKRTYRLDGGAAYTLDFAAVVSLGVLEGRWKLAQTGGLVGGVDAGGADVALQVEFSSYEEWNDLRGRLLDMPGIDDIRVGAVTERSAQVNVRYPGGGPALATAMAPQGLSLQNVGGAWVVRPNY